MPLRQFIPFRSINKYEKVLVVDSYHPRGVMLSHWRGAQRFAIGIADDTSAGIVLNALKKGGLALDTPFVTNNHWDIDGFLGVWALFEPEKALYMEHVIREAALIGDFREFNPTRPGADLALKIVCWFNAVEKSKFYAPFDLPEEAGDTAKEFEACVAKYTFFLKAFPDFLQDIDAQRGLWEPEYKRVYGDLDQLEGCRILCPEIRLMVVAASLPVHYYALFSQSEQTDLVLTLYPGQRYELEYKYTGWVDTAFRKSFPRIDLGPLAAILSAKDSISWMADSIMDTGPMLRPQREVLPKHARYASPFEREHQQSSLPPEVVEPLIVNFFRKRLSLSDKQITWTWQEMRQANEKIAAVQLD